jgi:hypothetical protein
MKHDGNARATSTIGRRHLSYLTSLFEPAVWRVRQHGRSQRSGQSGPEIATQT